MERNTITFITLNDHTLQAIIDNCYELGMMEEFNVEGRTISQLAYLPIADRSLIIVSGEIIIPAIKPYLHENCKIIVAQRTINYTNIREMLEIPRGMKVLLVNDGRERALDTIARIKELGIELDFHPFYPGQTTYPQEITIAVTPGEAKLVPPTIHKVIDIGSRVIDFATWIEIFDHFKYGILDLRRLISRYVHSVVYITKELSDEIQKANLLRNHLGAIVDRIEDGVLAIDEEDKIRITNQKALEILHLQGRKIIHQQAEISIPAHFYQIICQLPYEKEEVMNWESQTFFFRKTNILIDGRNFGYLILFRRASEINKLEHDYRRKQSSKGLVAKYTFSDLTGISAAFTKFTGIARNMARSSSTILLLGETGTGKELLAQAIHNASARRWEPFVGVNFAAISESLLESELFGYEEGAFTGAKKGGHIGLFEQAHKGTIFLDEIGDASAVIQNRLLRVLQEREIMKVGGNRVIPVDIRVVAATNRNLDDMVQAGLFRADLYYRLNVLPVYIPALRDRKDDIPLLVQEFIKKICNELKRPNFRFSREAMDNMLDYRWPGNIRELENIIQYLAHVVEDIVVPEHLVFNRQDKVYQEIPGSKGLELEAVYQSYVGKGFIQEVKLILQTIQQAKSAVGRNYVIGQLKTVGWDMTEQKLRYRMQLLKQDKLLEVGRGRQGSTLTPKGAEFLSYIK
ncbi:sigma 54-interacting transcriptional regulator [Sporomusa malonica]|uniref:Transcriptional regulator containing PAS, AAA-type ATPase, and DNA-binding Fis domains n=1 Tax=Sporomusa malonica TaxID=112901 RepID=A0A1W1ZN52_9FIRM|nr:sigma 54-interacting transcriptional regulator [Sporomusa malonica]SMC49683.1 Transcriptional regulator containing PAS, AAA-type ATPase, and DNA-binding Fis domains [Sporomusa malonica]